MKGFRFEPNAEGIFDAANGEAVRGILDQRAQEARKQILALAPRKRSFFDYRRNIKAVKAKRVGRSYEAAVVVDSPGWHLPEFGTANLPPTAPIRRGVRLAKLDFRED